MNDRDERQSHMQHVQPATLDVPTSPLSPGVRVNNVLFVSGQVPFGPNRELLGDDFAGQVRATLDNVDKVAREAGSSLEHAVKLGVYLSSLDHFQAMNRVFEEYFAAPYPARTTVAVELRGFDVEIDAVILIPDSD